MTTLLERPSALSKQAYVDEVETDPLQVIVAAPGTYSPLEVVQAYCLLGERPIPLCDSEHTFASANHINGYFRKDGSVVPPCTNPGKAPLERDYPRFASDPPTRADIVRMFGSHRGNVGGVVQEGRIIVDVDPRSGGLGVCPSKGLR